MEQICGVSVVGGDWPWERCQNHRWSVVGGFKLTTCTPKLHGLTTWSQPMKGCTKSACPNVHCRSRDFCEVMFPYQAFDSCLQSVLLLCRQMGFVCHHLYSVSSWNLTSNPQWVFCTKLPETQSATRVCEAVVVDQFVSCSCFPQIFCLVKSTHSCHTNFPDVLEHILCSFRSQGKIKNDLFKPSNRAKD